MVEPIMTPRRRVTHYVGDGCVPPHPPIRQHGLMMPEAACMCGSEIIHTNGAITCGASGEILKG